jgi:hypothetical protein
MDVLVLWIALRYLVHEFQDFISALTAYMKRLISCQDIERALQT